MSLRFVSALTVCVSLAVGLCLVGSASAAGLYTEGHGDLGFGDHSTIEPHMHLHGGATVDGSPLASDTEYEPDELIVYVPDSTRQWVADNGGRPAGTAWDPIGVLAGEEYWFLPASNSLAGTLGAPFLGLGTEHMDTGVFDNDELSMTLTAMTGPAGGHFSLWYDGFGPTFEMSTADGISAADTVANFPIPAHDHRNWGFTKPGTYELTFEISGTQGGTPVAEPGTFTFQVVPEPGSLTILLAGLVSLVALGRGRRRTVTA